MGNGRWTGGIGQWARGSKRWRRLGGGWAVATSGGDGEQLAGCATVDVPRWCIGPSCDIQFGTHSTKGLEMDVRDARSVRYL